MARSEEEEASHRGAERSALLRGIEESVGDLLGAHAAEMRQIRDDLRREIAKLANHPPAEGRVLVRKKPHIEEENLEASEHEWAAHHRRMVASAVMRRGVDDDSDEDDEELLQRVRAGRASRRISVHSNASGIKKLRQTAVGGEALSPKTPAPTIFLPGQLEGDAEPQDSEGSGESQELPKCGTYVRGFNRHSVAPSKSSDMLRTRTMRLENPCMIALHIRAKALLKNPKFEYGICFIIIVNAMLLGLQTELVARGIVKQAPFALIVLEAVMCVIFVLELALRMFVYRFRMYRMTGWQWNIFDTLIVSIQVVEQIMTIVMEDEAVMMNFSAARVIRTMKLVRLLRMARLFKGIGELRILIISIMNALKSLAWTVLLLTLMVYTLSVYMTQLVSDTKKSLPPDAEHLRALNQYFGTVALTMMSLFMSLTGGLDWFVLADPLMDTVSPLLGVLFTLYIAFSLFAMLNVVTGVFVQSVLKSQAADRDLFMVSNARDLFLTLDGGLSATMTWEIFEGKLDAPQMQAFLSAIDVDPSEARGLFRLLDLDGSGTISVDEFLNGALRLRGTAKALDVALLLQEVRKVDRKLSSIF